MKHLIPLLILCFLLTGFTGCEKPTEPKDTPEPDTTSHNFVWEVDTIGYRNIRLSDGVIISENDMWVVGEIYPDSASYWKTIKYGAAHWDGQKWTPIQLPVKTLAGYTGNLTPASIIQVGENKFWLGIVHEFDGEKITKSWWIHYFDGNPNPVFEEGKNPTRLYQTPDGTVYCYGYGGSLGYYNGSSWVKIPTNTDLDIVDLHGDWNPATREYELLALASTTSEIRSSELLKVNKHGVELVSVSGLNLYPKLDIWFEGNLGYWIAGLDGTSYEKSLSDSSWIQKTDYPNSWRTTSAISGNSERDLFLLQSGGHVLHFNGSTWKDFRLETSLFAVSDFYYEVIVKGDLVLIFGFENTDPNRGIVIRGRRVN